MPRISAISAAVIQRRRSLSIASTLWAGVLEGIRLGPRSGRSSSRHGADAPPTWRLFWCSPGGLGGRGAAPTLLGHPLASSSREFGQVLALA